MEENNTPDLTNKDNYIYHDDSAGYLEEDENVPTSAVNLYNQLDTRGELGGIHSGRVLLKTYKSNQSIVIKNFNSNHILTGISIYNPKIKHNGMVSWIPPKNTFEMLLSESIAYINCFVQKG